MTVQKVQAIYTTQNKFLRRIAMAILLFVSHANTYISSSTYGLPTNWLYACTNYYYSYVGDESSITSITVNQDPTGNYLYALVVNGRDSGISPDSAYVLSPCPNYSTDSTLLQTVTLTAS
jgi:hypothetical protein